MAAVVSTPPILSPMNSLRQTSSRVSLLSFKSNGSQVIIGNGQEDDATVTVNRTLVKGKQRSIDDLQLLALGTQMTEISYSISDIQTRIFEIQELRHQADASSTVGSSTSTAPTSASASTETPESTTSHSGITTLDQALMNLEERLESISKSIAAIDETLEPYSKPSDTPTQSNTPKGDPSSSAMLDSLLRKHVALKEEWDGVQKEADVLRSELREDKWLAVFRSVGEQSDSMMNSLEKALANCQAFIWQVHHRGPEDGHSQGSGTSAMSDRPLNLEVYQTILSSYESKKKYYVPSISKVLGILDRTVRDRITKNGECLRTHAEARARWKLVQERIAKTDAEMEKVRQILVNRDKDPEASDAGSTVSRLTSKTSKSNSNYLSTPSSSRRGTNSSSASAALQRSISPFRRLASKVSNSLKGSGRQTPSSLTTSPAGASDTLPTPPRLPPKSPHRPHGRPVPEDPKATSITPLSASTSSTSKKRDSYFPFLNKDPSTMRVSPRSASRGPPPVANGFDRPPSRLSTSNDPTGTLRPKWNASTKVVETPLPPVTKPSSSRRTSISGSHFRPVTPQRPPTSQSNYSPPKVSTTMPTPSKSSSSPPSGQTLSRAPSRAGAQTPYGTHTAPRARPQTPSHIPRPSISSLSSGYVSGGGGPFARPPSSASSYTGPTSLMQRALSPGGGTSSGKNSGIPLPKVSVTPGSRPGSALGGPTPDATPTKPTLVGGPGVTISRIRNTSGGASPAPSSFVPPPLPNFNASTASAPASSSGASAPVMAVTISRPGSRNTNYSRSGLGGAITPALTEINSPLLNTTTYTPNKLDELDVEVADTVNSIPHSLLVERLDPVRKGVVVKSTGVSGEEIKGQYAVSSLLSRKVITCRLVSVGGSTSGKKKVMCRVGGGWMDLSMYILNRQAQM